MFIMDLKHPVRAEGLTGEPTTQIIRGKDTVYTFRKYKWLIILFFEIESRIFEQNT